MFNKKIKIAINGFGRIGRAALKIALKKSNLEVVAINDLGELENLAYLLKYDSVYGVYPRDIKAIDNKLVVGDREILVFSEKDPANLPWNKLGVDIILECTGFFTNRENASKHLQAGAKKVIISAPTKDRSIKTVVIGVNDSEITPEDNIVANASCTTNCLAPMARVLNDRFEIEKALMSTIHSYTATQSLVDRSCSKDMRRGRSAAQNIVPSSTGAAIATTLTIPQLAGKFDGMAYRIPTIVGSVSDLTVLLKNNASTEEINNAFKEAAKESLKNIMQVCDDPIVSRDIVGNPHSVIVDTALTKVVGENFVKVVGWYDNEWGYSNRLVELVDKLITHNS